MSLITLSAHFDGQQIVLDEPFELPCDARLLVTVSSHQPMSEDDPWATTAAIALTRAYSNDEPSYTLEDIA